MLQLLLMVFFYQRYYCIYHILNNNDFNYIVEEGCEDIDIIKINNNRDVIQVKYCGDMTESLTISSRLYKVIEADYNKNNIDNIIYCAYNKTDTIYHKDLKKIFDDKKYFNIGKYFLILFYNNIINEENKNIADVNNKIAKINIDIRCINNIDKIYNDNLLIIENKLKIKNANIYNFFSNVDNCCNYFMKFKLEDGLSFNDLQNAIENKIIDKFNIFIESNDDKYKKIKIELIKSIIFNTLIDKMIKCNNNVDNRKIYCNEIMDKINETINTCTDVNNLYYELLKQTESIIRTSINNNSNSIERINIFDYINNINNINIDSLDNISFYLCLLNCCYDKLNNDEINNIKNYIIKFIWSKYNPKDNDYKINKKMIKCLNMISEKSPKYRNVPHEKILKIIDSEHEIKTYFIKKKNKKNLI